LKAASDESTSWYLPEVDFDGAVLDAVARQHTAVEHLLTSLLDGRMKLFGIVPPTMWSMNAKLYAGS